MCSIIRESQERNKVETRRQELRSRCAASWPASHAHSVGFLRHPRTREPAHQLLVKKMPIHLTTCQSDGGLLPIEVSSMACVKLTRQLQQRPKPKRVRFQNSKLPCVFHTPSFGFALLSTPSLPLALCSLWACDQLALFPQTSPTPQLFSHLFLWAERVY